MIPLLSPHAWPLSPSHFFTKTAFKTLIPKALGQSISCRTVIAEVASQGMWRGTRKEGRKEGKKEGKKDVRRRRERASYPNVPRNGDGVVFLSLHSLTANAIVSVHIMPSW
jgi:hypothetical protein